MTMRSQYNAELEFNEECASGELARLSDDDKKKYNEFVRRLNNPRRDIPEHYKGEVKRMAKRLNSSRLNATEAPLTDEQVFEVDSFIARTWYEAQPMKQLLAPVTRTMSKPAWELKYYTIAGDTYPAFTAGGPSAFREPKSFKLGVTPAKKEGLGAAIRYDLSWTLLAEAGGGVYDPLNWHNIKGTELFGELWDERYCLGTAGLHTSGDLGSKGLGNATSAQTLTVSGDNTCNGAGEVDTMLLGIAGLLRTAKEPGPNVLVSTSGFASECFYNDSSYTDRSVYERVKHKWFDSGIFSKWVVDDRLFQAAAATNTQRFCAFRLSEQAIRVHTIYPFQKKPLVNKEYAEDVAYALLTADTLAVINPNAIVVTGAATTTTHAGIARNGLFMSGGGANMGYDMQGMPQPGTFPGGLGGSY